MRLRVLLAALVATAPLATPAPAQAAIGIGPSAPAFASALDVPAGALVSATYAPPGAVCNTPPMPCSSTNLLGVGIADTPIAGFPLAGSTFGILANGPAASADDPNNWPGGSEPFLDPGPQTNFGEDLSWFQVTVHVPADRGCVLVDYAFFSEEFPEFIGSTQYVDAFVIQVGTPNITVQAGGTITAPGNVAVDAAGNPVTTNTAFVTQVGDTGTTYDGRTELLTASIPATPDSDLTITFSLLDGVDVSDFDSAAFIDNVRFATTGCQPVSAPANSNPRQPFAVTLDDPAAFTAGLAGSPTTILLFLVEIRNLDTGATQTLTLARQGIASVWSSSVRLTAGRWRYTMQALIDDGDGSVTSFVARRAVRIAAPTTRWSWAL